MSTTALACSVVPEVKKRIFPAPSFTPVVRHPASSSSRSPSPLSAEDPTSRAGRRHLAAAIKKLEKHESMVKISTGQYTGVSQQLGSWQSDYNIPQELK